jgi:hypothetical protein
VAVASGVQGRSVKRVARQAFYKPMAHCNHVIHRSATT